MVGAQRHFLPLSLLVSVSVLFFFTHFYSYLPFPSNPNPDFTISHKSSDPDFIFIIKVLAYNRLDSLSRCLRSIANADYLSDRVHLHVYIDHFPHENSHLKLNESHQILQFVDQFVWNFGEKLVHYRTGNVGLQAQWLEAWWPSSDNEFSFVLEDDLEVSPLYYKFLKSLILNYYYNASNYSPLIYGASLQRPRFVPGKHGNKINLDSRTRLFLYQLVGTWGQLLFPNPWKEFRLWYDEHKAKGAKPILDGMVTTGWYKKMGERIWTPWFIKFIHSRGYFNIYTNFLHERALSTSHRDAGVNYGKTAGPDSILLNGSSLDFNLLEMKPLTNLKWYDFCFREVLPQRIIQSADELESVLQSVHRQENIIIVSFFGVSESMVRNFLCHFERLNIRNYVLLGLESKLLHDLMRRGHPVIDAARFLMAVKTFKYMAFEDAGGELAKLVLAKFYVIKSCLELGYNPMLIDGNMLLVNGDPFTDFNLADDNIHLGQSSELFFMKSSSSARKMWDRHIVPGAEATVESLANRGSLSRDSISLVGIATKLLEQHGAKLKRVDEMAFGAKIDDNLTNSSLGHGKGFVFWSTDTNINDVQRHLMEFGFWIIDDDFSCKGVYCNRL